MVLCKCFPLVLATSLWVVSGCHSPDATPAQLQTEFVQAIAEGNVGEMSHLVSQTQPGGTLLINLNAPYDSPESQKDPALQGETLFMWALRTGHFKGITMLVPSMGVRTRAGRTPLMYAALYGPEVGPDQNMVMIALQALDPQVGAVDRNGDSALFLAAQRGAPSAMAQLLRAGACVCFHRILIRNKQGKTALDLARASKNDWTVRLIQREIKKEMSPPRKRRF